MKHLRVLGTRGIPGVHGGFETFAERLSLYLVARGWKVTVYCQEVGKGPIVEDLWHGVDRVRIPVRGDGAGATVLFDWLSLRHAMREKALCLTLGYNTALFCALLRLAHAPNVINMDGIEWRRAKWGAFAKMWFWLNERAGCWLGDHLVADHPEILRHLAKLASTSKITMLPYGADAIDACEAMPVHELGLVPGEFLTLIVRPEPENSVLEIVQAFSRRSRGQTLAVLGNYSDRHAYHRQVRAAASPEVRFLGAIYDQQIVRALRFYGAAYVHGHQVGGTNPSLVEALGAGNAVIAHDNPFNRWVAGDAARYFRNTDDAAAIFDSLCSGSADVAAMQRAARDRHAELFTWPAVLADYEKLLIRFLKV